MKILRALSVVWMVLVLAAGSVTMAMARHQPRAIGEIDLCTGFGMVSVAVDAQGKPTGPLMPCPDATPALAALTDAAVPVIQTPGTVMPMQFRLRDLRATVLPINTHHHSRAPPVTV
ncbi:hypothetical protein [Pararhodobacter sp.]|uniref:hypothetical protein n=1 Tax=Pararhodobacter sp. TaxID=2127056 RepID=UPI002AFFA962|nr:hypothetical protein [Pararhodobacter sp.]